MTGRLERWIRPAPQADFGPYARAISVRCVALLSASIAAALIVFWPTDWFFFEPGSPQRAAYTLLRPPVIGAAALVLLALWRLRWARRHPALMLCAFDVAVALTAGFALEAIPDSDMDLVWVYSGYLLPLGTLGVVLPLRQRAALTIGITLVCGGLFFAVHPTLLDLPHTLRWPYRSTAPPGAAPMIVVAFSCLVSIALGQVIYVLLRTNHDQRAQLAQTQESLRALNERISRQLESKAADVARLVDDVDRSLEDERRHISRELHDDLGQLLTGLRIDLALAQARAGDPAAIRKRLEKLDQHLELALEALSRIVGGLRPRALDELGLIEASQSVVRTFSRRAGIPCEMTLDADALSPPLALGDAQAGQVYRILQESLTNISRHAQAAHVEVSLRVSGGRLCLTVADDGKGFDLESENARARHGLIGMRERADSLGGVLTIESAPGAGTTVRLELPLGQAGVERPGVHESN